MLSKGVSPLRVIVTIVVAMVVGVAAVLMRRSGETEVGVPVYSGSEETPMPPYLREHVWYAREEGVSVSFYFVEGKEAEEILSWYKREMVEKGYEKYVEIPVVSIAVPAGSLEWGWVVFRKGNRAVAVCAFSGTTEGRVGCWYALAEGALDKLIPPSGPSAELPASDQASGFEPIPRYPGSVMLSHETGGPWPDRVSIAYGSSENRHRVIGSWFESQLVSAGWRVLDEEESESLMILQLRKGENEVGIYIYPPDDQRTYSRIEVTFDSWRVPANDLEQARTEPVQRYPGSVVVDYTDMVSGNVKNVIVTYVSKAGADEIFGWYVGSLPGQGWRILMHSPDERSLTASKDASTLIIRVTPNERQYTEIEVAGWVPA